MDRRLSAAPSLRINAAIALICLLGGLVATPAACLAGDWVTGNWVTGVAFRRQLAQPIKYGGAGTALTLGQAVGSLSRVGRVAVVIDRRIDPDRRLDVPLSDAPLETAFRRLAAAADAQIAVVEPIVYVGPVRTGRELRTVIALRRQEARRLPTAAARTFLSKKRLAWDDFAEPRQLLSQMAEQDGIGIAGLQRIPHDLWKAAQWPPLTLVERLVLITAQFGLTFQIDSQGKSITLVPLPAEIGLVRDYPAGDAPEKNARRLASLAPRAKIKIIGKKIYVKGLVEDHERIVAGPKRPGTTDHPVDPVVSKDLSNKRFSLNVIEQPAAAVFNTLEKSVPLTLIIDYDALRAAGISLDRRVTLRVDEATIDKLLGSITSPLGLKFTRQGRTVRIGPAD